MEKNTKILLIITGITIFLFIIILRGGSTGTGNVVSEPNSENIIKGPEQIIYEGSKESVKEVVEEESKDVIEVNFESVEEIVEEPKVIEPLDNFLVTRVIDGDTIEISTGERVRLICIDTPEVGDEGYSEATDYLESLILNKSVRLEKDVSETDRYGRLLRYIYLEDETFVNERIVYYGYGEAYPYNPDTSLCPEIQEAEQYAKDNDLGIWEEEEIIEEEPQYPICSYNAYNCDDFGTCSEVMEIFELCGGVDNDIHWLDGDDDGVPCEVLCG